MNKAITFLFIFLSFFVFLKVFKKDNLNLNNYDNGFCDGINSFYLNSNIDNTFITDTDKFFLSTFFYSTFFDKTRQKGYIDGYFHAVNQTIKNNHGNYYK